MSAPIYPAARLVAPLVEGELARKSSKAHRQGESGLAPRPDAQTIEILVNVAFWASLRREEGRAPKISLAFHPPEQAWQPLRFERQLPLSPVALTRLAPAVERRGIHLGVWPEGDELRVWGTTRTLPQFCCVVEVIQPGLLVIKYRRGGELGKFGNIAVLEGDQIRVVDEQVGNPPDCPRVVTSLLSFDSRDFWADPVNGLVQLAVSMRTHGRGGTLLVVPDGNDAWRESILWPLPYAVVPSFPELADLMDKASREKDEFAWQESVRRSVDAVGGLTAVDGATVITDRYRVLAFGAKIGRRGPPVEEVILTEPIAGGVGTVISSGQLGGTRHLSAAQFVHDQREALALVASQDGRFTIFSWAASEEMVRAHRVEILLL